MVERVTRKNENLESELPLTISAQYGLIDQNEFFDKRIASRDVSGYYLLKKGEFAYNKSTSSDAPWGAVKRLDRYEMGVLSTLYIVFALKENGNIDSDFLVSYYDTDCWHKGVQAIAAEGARNHGLLNITPADYFETVLTVPSDVKEQHQIGTFFAKLDSLITLHQREYFLFDFSGESAKTAQNTLSWEQRKLSDLFEERNEQAPMDEEYPLMAFIANIGVAPKGDRYDRSALVHDEKGKKYKRTEKGDFIYSSNNLETGSIGLNNYGNACISPVYSIFKSKHTVDPEFMGRILLRKEFINQMVSFRQGVVYGQWKIHEDDFLNLDILVPQTTEQQKIGGFFSELDKIITLHQHKPNKKGHDVLTVMPFKGNQRKPHYLCT